MIQTKKNIKLLFDEIQDEGIFQDSNNYSEEGT